MRRRGFLSGLGLTALPSALRAQEARKAPADPVEAMVATPDMPRMAIPHVGFHPRRGTKTVVVRDAGRGPRTAALYDVAKMNTQRPGAPLRTLPLVERASDFGPALTADFTDLETTGIYQLVVGEERSFPFPVRDDAWRRTLPRVFGYLRAQRCGVNVPGVHPPCHLDDALRRDDGKRIDAVGGWHDAGDLRKWSHYTMLNGIALVQLMRLIPRPGAADVPHAAILEELRHGSSYFLKLQDADGRVFHHVGAGSEETDNHWTDNHAGTADDRHVDVSKPPHITAIFAVLQAMVSRVFARSDKAYAKRCLQAAERAFAAIGKADGVHVLAWTTWAAAELAGATGKAEYRTRAGVLGRVLIDMQVTGAFAGQGGLRGFFHDGATPFVHLPDGAVPALALLAVAELELGREDSARVREALAMYCDGFVAPLCARNAYGIMPWGLWAKPPTPETYRQLDGQLVYRYFHPVWQGGFWQGASCHLAAHAVVLARHRSLTGGQTHHAALALRNLGWIAGANPFAACLITGEGWRNPVPHSRFVGLVPGGIMNGVAGNLADEPVLDTKATQDWRTTEYWSPHVAYWLWAVAALET